MFPDPDFLEDAGILAIRFRQILHFSYLHGFSEPLGQNGGFLGENRGRDGAILTANELLLTFGGLHLCVQFGKNRQRNATVTVTTHGRTDRRKPILLSVRCYML